MIWRLSIRKHIPPKKNLSVDVFIPIYNESVDLVRKTLGAAINIEYPHKTYLLDDGKNPKMKELAKSMGAYYLARSTNEDSKAGNLNYGLKHSKGDYIAIFDSDHIPNKKFLTKTLGYFEDKKVAFVQTPQDFYNTNSFQHRYNFIKNLIWSEQALFFKIIQRGKDSWNAAFLCGSCAVLTRASLKKIGGFATGTITEDVHTSIRLHKAGYKSVYYSETLAYGIAGSTIEPFIIQRIRWGQGAMQVIRKEGFIFSSKLTLAQKINYSASAFTYFDGWQKMVYYIAPVITLLFGILPIQTTSVDFAIFFLPYIFINYLIHTELSRGYGDISFVEQYNMARFFAFAYATLTLIFNFKLNFKVTNKEVVQKISNYFLYPSIIVYLSSAVGIIIGIFNYYFNHFIPLDVLIMVVLWSFINLYIAHQLINFSKKKNITARNEYRVLLSHATHIFIGGKKILAIAQNISSNMITIKALLPKVSVKEILSGEIYFPKNTIPFHARIKTIKEIRQGLFSVTCVFIWKNDNYINVLNKYIYNSNHHIIFNNIKEFELTPLQKFFNFFKSQKSPEAVYHDRWFPFLVHKKAIGVIIQRRKKNGSTHYAILNQAPGKQIFDGQISYNHLNMKSKFKVKSILVDDNSETNYYLTELQRMRGQISYA
jgi:cellulose synthase (UDP-forming)